MAASKESSVGLKINQSLYPLWNQTSRNPRRHLPLFRGADTKELQMLRREGAKRHHLAVSDRGLHGAQTALFRHHNMTFRRNAGRQIGRPFLLIATDGLVAIEIQSVCNLPFHVENGNRTIGCAKVRQPLVDGPS